MPIMRNLNLISVQSWTYLVCLNSTILMLLASSVHMLQQMFFSFFFFFFFLKKLANVKCISKTGYSFGSSLKPVLLCQSIDELRRDCARSILEAFRIPSCHVHRALMESSFNTDIFKRKGIPWHVLASLVLEGWEGIAMQLWSTYVIYLRDMC